MVEFLSLEPFVPSGKDFESSKQLFEALGFTKTWDQGGMAGFDANGCKFILQQYDAPDFAQNFMISIKVTNVDQFWRDVIAKKLPEKFGIRVSAPKQQPYGKEVNIIDIAGVCWHFVE